MEEKMAKIKLSENHIHKGGWGFILFDNKRRKHVFRYADGFLEVTDELAKDFEGNKGLIIEYSKKHKAAEVVETIYGDIAVKFTKDEVYGWSAKEQKDWLKSKDIVPAKYEKDRVKQILENQ